MRSQCVQRQCEGERRPALKQARRGGEQARPQPVARRSEKAERQGAARDVQQPVGQSPPYIRRPMRRIIADSSSTDLRAKAV